VRPRLWIVGAGGHAKVVIATARAAGYTDLALADDSEAARGATVLGVPVACGTREVLSDGSATAVLAIGSNETRRRLAEGARSAFATVVHPAAIVDASVTLEPGTVVFAGTVIQPDTRLGAHAIVNTGASIDHDGAIGAFTHIAPGARLAGNVTLGTGVFVGIGAVVVPGITVGEWTTVGAGAAVVRDLPPRATAVGVPARVRSR